jgi:hypothetical protein
MTAYVNACCTLLLLLLLHLLLLLKLLTFYDRKHSVRPCSNNLK